MDMEAKEAEEKDEEGGKGGGLVFQCHITIVNKVGLPVTASIGWLYMKYTSNATSMYNNTMVNPYYGPVQLVHRI